MSKRISQEKKADKPTAQLSLDLQFDEEKTIKGKIIRLFDHQQKEKYRVLKELARQSKSF